MHNRGRILEFDLDDDDLDGVALSQLQSSRQDSRSGRRRGEQSMPLLVGLLDASTVRRSIDSPEYACSDPRIDLEELAAKRHAGGGLLDSVANMANSILGAGIIGVFYMDYWMTSMPDMRGQVSHMPYDKLVSSRGYYCWLCCAGSQTGRSG